MGRVLGALPQTAPTPPFEPRFWLEPYHFRKRSGARGVIRRNHPLRHPVNVTRRSIIFSERWTQQLPAIDHGTEQQQMVSLLSLHMIDNGAQCST